MSVTTTPRRRSLLQRFGLGRSSASFAIAANGATAQVAPPQSQACESGTALVPGVRLFHDGSGRPPSVGDDNNGSTRVETAEFDGSYVSLVADLPPELASRIRPGVNLAIRIEVEADPALPVFVRGHFGNEEGREVLHDLIVLKDGPRTVRFNLDGLRIPLDLATTGWVDIVCSNPSGATLTVRKIALEIEAQ